MALNPQSILLRRLSQAGLVDTGLAQRLIQEKAHQHQSVAELLIVEKLISAKALAESVAAFTMHSLIDLDFFEWINSIVNTGPKHISTEMTIINPITAPAATVNGAGNQFSTIQPATIQLSTKLASRCHATALSLSESMLRKPILPSLTNI